jgi:hypothetical protein
MPGAAGKASRAHYRDIFGHYGKGRSGGRCPREPRLALNLD